MFRFPRTLLDLHVAEQYCVSDWVRAWTAGKFIALDLASEDDSGEWVEVVEGSLSAIVGARIAAGDLRPLYLAWLASYGTWERDEYAFDREHDDELEPPVPPGLATLTAPQQALARQRRLDELAYGEEMAWARIDTMIATRKPGEYDAAVALLTELQALAMRDRRSEEFTQRCAALRQTHSRKPGLIERFNRAGIGTDVR